MKMKTSELTDVALDWAVTKCMGYNHDVSPNSKWGMWGWATDWAQGGPIIEREGIQLAYRVGVNWTATRVEGSSVCEVDVPYNQRGSAQLIAAMRCYVMSQYGDEIEIPDELKGE